MKVVFLHFILFSKVLQVKILEQQWPQKAS